MKGSAALKKEAKDESCWRGFRARRLVHFHQRARFYCPERHALTQAMKSFSPAASKRTKAVWEKLQPYFQEERKKGVLAVDAKNPSTLLAHKAGYIDRDNEMIVGLQTDEPFKRAIFPFGGLRMVEAGLKAAGFPADPQVHEAFTKYRKSHNDGVFDAYTPEIMKCRKSGIVTGLPDAYGRGRIIGDYRRVALYGVDQAARGQGSRTRTDGRHVAEGRGHQGARGTGRADACAERPRRDGETLQLRHHRGRRSTPGKHSSGRISPILAPSKKRMAQRCRSAVSRASWISTSNAT